MPRGLTNVRRPLLALIVLVAALVIGYVVKAADDDGKGPSATPSPTVSASASARAGASAPARSSTRAGSSDPRTVHGLPVVALYQLPAQASDTLELIQDGGPYPYPRNDGVVFHNNERVLPSERDGYYHEYTVPTPGSSDRGARRIVTGKDGTYYYTGDHYEHFSVIALGG